jgi:histidine ammonia-lyase
MNSVDDNPLVDVARNDVIQAGNFFAQYVGTGMDQMRQSIALIAKQLDAQISLLVMPEFNKGLPSSLALADGGVKFGLKGLQICANAIVPRLLHLGNPICCFFPTHAEQFNQNINSQGFNAAVLAGESVTVFKHYLAAALIFAIQGVELRAHARHSTYSGNAILSARASRLYETFYRVVGRVPSPDRPLVEKNYEIALDGLMNAVFDDLETPSSKIFGTIGEHKLGQAFL